VEELECLLSFAITLKPFTAQIHECLTSNPGSIHFVVSHAETKSYLLFHIVNGKYLCVTAFALFQVFKISSSIPGYLVPEQLSADFPIMSFLAKVFQTFIESNCFNKFIFSLFSESC
jgi:hypothetical protein